MQEHNKSYAADNVAKWIRQTALLSMIGVSAFYLVMTGIVSFLLPIAMGGLALYLRNKKHWYNLYTAMTYLCLGVALNNMQLQNDLPTLFMIVGGLSLATSLFVLFINLKWNDK